MAEEAFLARGFRGLNRAVAKHLLPDDQSPDCNNCSNVSDDGYAEGFGMLGPRRGRKRVTSFGSRILGVMPCNFPWGRFRIIAKDDGVWEPYAVPWPAAVSQPLNGWDIIDISGLTASQAGVGINEGTAKVLASPLDVSVYGAFLIGDDTYRDSIDVTYGGAYATGYVKLQLRIDAGWVDFIKVNVIDGVGPDWIQMLYEPPASGTLDAVRMKAEILTGGGTLDVTTNLQVHLVYGAAQSTQTPS